MPGYLRKWSSKRPPKLRVTSEEGSEIDARLTCKRPLARPTPPDTNHRGSGCVLIWDLADLDLPDGDYEITVGSNDLIIGTELVRLRSADNPSLQLDSSIGSIGHHPGHPGYGLLASTDSTIEFFQVSSDLYGPLGEAAVPSVPSWWSARATKRVQKPWGRDLVSAQWQLLPAWPLYGTSDGTRRSNLNRGHLPQLRTRQALPNSVSTKDRQDRRPASATQYRSGQLSTGSGPN